MSSKLQALGLIPSTGKIKGEGWGKVEEDRGGSQVLKDRHPASCFPFIHF
jgi:hypothetical protein